MRRMTHKPIKRLSRLLCLLLNVYAGVMLLEIGSEIWSHFLAKATIAQLENQELENEAQKTAVVNASRNRLETLEAEVEAILDESPKEHESVSLDLESQIQALVNESDKELESVAGKPEEEVQAILDNILKEPEAAPLKQDEHSVDQPMVLDALINVESDEPNPTERVIGVPRLAIPVAFQVGINLVSMSLYIITGCLFLIWVYRVSRNLHFFSGQGMKYTPVWSVASYMVPFVNVFVPPAVMSEIWAVSHKSAAGSFVPLWWALVVISWLTWKMYWNAIGQADAWFADKTLFYCCLAEFVSIALTITTASLVDRIALAYAQNIDDNLTPGTGDQ